METPKVNSFAEFAVFFGRARVIVAAAVVSLAILAGAVTALAVAVGLDSRDQDWVTALVVTIVLGAASILLQRNQMRHDRLWLQREYTFNIVSMAMNDPIYAQCWGPRVSPPEMEERLFSYANMMIMLWSYAWRHGQIDSHQVRVYTRAFFDSEVAREYWKSCGALRSRGPRRDRAFYKIVDEEYARAVAAGPPARPYEPAAPLTGATAPSPDPLLRIPPPAPHRRIPRTPARRRP